MTTALRLRRRTRHNATCDAQSIPLAGRDLTIRSAKSGKEGPGRRRRSRLKRLENGARRTQRSPRDTVRYAHRDRRNHNSLADYIALGEVLTDGARRGIVTSVTIAGCPQITAVSVAKAGVVEKAMGAGFGRGRTLVQSQKLVEALPNRGESPHDCGDEPRYERFAGAMRHVTPHSPPKNRVQPDNRLLIVAAHEPLVKPGQGHCVIPALFDNRP
jgi:hypothetical protein